MHTTYQENVNNTIKYRAMRFIKCISMIIGKIMYSYDDKYFLRRFIKGLGRKIVLEYLFPRMK